MIAPGAPSWLEGVAEGVGGGKVEFNLEDEKRLEELIGELNVSGKPEWEIEKTEEKDIRELVRDMRGLLPEVKRSVVEGRSSSRVGEDGGEGGRKEEGLTDWENVEVDIGSGGVKVGREESKEYEEGEDEDEEQDKKKTEDDEADDVIARVMAELAINKKYGGPDESPDHTDSKSEADSGDETEEQKNKSSEEAEGSLNLPSAPTSIPQMPQDDLAETQALEDALTARLAALSKPRSQAAPSDSLGLPSAPSFAPSNKPPKVTSNLPTYTDEEIDTWCIICNDDATLRCLGCDGDLYCQNCWMEGHKGESAGYEERRHKAVLYSKKKGKRREAAAG